MYGEKGPGQEHVAGTRATTHKKEGFGAVVGSPRPRKR